MTLTPASQPTDTPTPSAPPEHWPDWSILVVDDEPGMRHFLLKCLLPRCPRVHACGSVEEAHGWLLQHHADLIVLDIALPGRDGLSWLKSLREGGWRGCVILITAFADLETAIEALRAGATDLILKPFRVPQLLTAIRHGFDAARLLRENFVLRHNLAHRWPATAALCGRSACMDELRSALPRLAASESPVLLQGESGTGKELVARTLHSLSARAQGPFVAVNCAGAGDTALSHSLFGHVKGAFEGATQARDGLFYYAQGGTLFLDEVAALPTSVQAALLRVLDDGAIRPVGSAQCIPVNVRVLAATQRRLADEVREGRFRADLYYRLQVVELTLPALRDHLEDLPELVPHLLAQLGTNPAALPITPEQWHYLAQYHWPGNVRELRNLLERSLILGELNVSALYDSARSTLPNRAPAPATLEALERTHIQHVLTQVGGDKTRAAALLGVSRRTLERRCAQWAQPGSASASYAPEAAPHANA